MSAKSRADLRAIFVSGARPTESDFGDLIDSFAIIDSSGVSDILNSITSAAAVGIRGIIEITGTANTTAHDNLGSLLAAVSASGGSISVISSAGSTSRTLATRYDDIRNVKDYGAIGDEITNDASAIQAAIDEGDGLVFFPAGTYKIDSGITLKEGVYLVGAGARDTEIKASGNFSAFTGTGTSSDAFQDCGISNMLIRGGWQIASATNTSAFGVTLGFPNRVRLENLIFHACRRAININHSAWTKLSNIDIFGGGDDQNYIGIYLGETNSTDSLNTINAVNVDCRNTASSGFRLIYPNGSKFTNCEAAGTDADPGWDIGGPDNATHVISFLHVNNCLSDNTGGEGWRLRRIGNATASNLRYMQFSNIWAGTTGADGMLIEGGESIVITNPLFVSISGHAVSMSSCTRCALTGGTLRGWDSGGIGKDGINLRDVDNSEFTGIHVQTGVSGAGVSLREDVNCSANVYTGNDFANNAIVSGGNGLYTTNLGFKTDARGSIIVTAGQTSNQVAHDLDLTPTINDISITPRTSLGSAVSFWISSVTSTTFQVNLQESNASNITFAWQIYYHNR